MKISRLKAVVLSVALLTSGGMLARAQDGSQFDLSFILLNAPVADVFGLPSIDASSLGVDVLDSTVYVDGAGKISGFALVSTTTESSSATLVLNISGKMGNDGTIPMAKMTLKGKGFSDNGAAQGKASLSLNFSGDVNEIPGTPIFGTTNICHEEQATNCVPATNTTFTIITNTDELTNAFTFVTNTTPISEDVLTWYATNVLHAADAGNSNVITTTSEVANTVPYFALSNTIVNICITNDVTTNCADYNNATFRPIASPGDATTNEVAFVSTNSAVTGTNTFYVQTNWDGVLVTNTLPYFVQTDTLVTNCTGVTTNVVVTDIVVATTNVYTEITDTNQLTNTALVIVTNTTPWGTNFVETNNIVLTTNARPVFVVVGAYVTNTAGLPYFSQVTTSGTNSYDRVEEQPVLITVCVTNTIIIGTNPPSFNIAGLASGTYNSGIKGESTVKLKNVSATIDDIDYTQDMQVNTSIVTFKNSFDVIGRLLAASFQDSGLPVIGNGSVKSGKFKMSLKGTAWGKGSNLKLDGTTSGDPSTDGASAISTLNANGKVLGQKIKTSSFQPAD